MDTNQEFPEAFIMKMPNEVLDMIVRAVIASYMNSYVCWPAAQLSRVCRRFYQIAQPYLYANLCMQNSGPFWRVTQLNRSLRQNPSLLPLCRHLIVRCDISDIVSRRSVSNCVTWLTSVQNFELDCLHKEVSWDALL